MAAPVVRINTFMKETTDVFIDPLSKVYIILEVIFGNNRLGVFSNIIFFYKAIVTVFCFVLIFTVVFTNLFTHSSDIVLWGLIVQYIFCTIFGFLSIKRLRLYYTKLNTFDLESGCRSKTTHESIKNLIRMSFSFMFFVLWFTLPYFIEFMNHKLLIQILPIDLTYVLELYYYGHLFHILSSKIRLINYYMSMSLEVKGSSSLTSDDFKFFNNIKPVSVGMRKLMELYEIVVEAYDCLIGSVKWQLLIIFMTSFVSNLTCAYHVSLKLIRAKDPIAYLLGDIWVTLMKLIPLFSPCMYSDEVHNEVKKTRDLLASILYENKLDKSSRRIGRALLAMTEARDMSFSLLRMVQIDVSLPFKYMGLLITYLIILLQFDKVINL